MKKINKKGFTLAELLVVVAVIAVLVAVAIPTFSSQLEKSRQAVDIANLRGAYAVAKIAAMDGKINGVAVDSGDWYYDPDAGALLHQEGSDIDASKKWDTGSDAAATGYMKGTPGEKIVADVAGLSGAMGYYYANAYASAVNGTGASRVLKDPIVTAIKGVSGVANTDEGVISSSLVKDKSVIKVLFVADGNGGYVPVIGFIASKDIA